MSYEDLAKYNTITQAQHKKVFPSYNVARFYSGETADPLIFCHFAENIQDKVYDMVSSITKLSTVLEDALREYNEVRYSTAQYRILWFRAAYYIVDCTCFPYHYHYIYLI